MIFPRFARFELALVVLVSLLVLVPGIGSYSLVDPWETHYGEVARMMLQNNDWVHTQWPGSLGGGFEENEGFRSKPVLQFWMMAAGMRAVGVAADGGYSGEMTDTARVMIGIRLPFILAAISGLVLMWWMLLRLVGRRAAWLGLLVVGSTPMFCMIARNAMPDMPLTACTIGAIALFILALEDGERPIVPFLRLGKLGIDARHVTMAIVGGIIVIQAIYYAIYFISAPQLAMRSKLPSPAIWLPLLMLLLLGATHHAVWKGIRVPFVKIGGTTKNFAEHVLGMARITKMRQVYLLGCYGCLGVSVLAKGPPGLTVVGAVGVLFVAIMGRWHELYLGDFELKRGVLLMIAIFLPWHLAMFLKDGIGFINEYLFQHVLNRAGSGTVDKSLGTFEHYTSQIGHGMWLWAALLPAALGAAFLRARVETREGRVRFIIALWAIVAVATFCLVQTKFHHYILPAIPPLALLVALFLDDIAAKRARLHPLLAAAGAGIVLLICRDLMFEPDRWIEMFVFRYDRPWPSGDPWFNDPSDGFLLLGAFAVVALIALATRFARIGVAAIGAAGLAICLWALHVYMPIAGTHWGMGDAVRTYYEQRSVHGQHLIYFGARQVHDDWHDRGETWSFETKIPRTLHVGQPMLLDVRIYPQEGGKTPDEVIVLVGTATAIHDHSVDITLLPGERDKLKPWIERGKTAKRSPRRPLRAVAADRLIAFQLYWRGENFWSQEEILGFLPEMKTAFPNTNNLEATKYFADRARSPFGRRYFAVGTNGQIQGLKALLPTERGRSSWEIVDSTSNKFWLASFEL
ncbi:MAG: glycosyltransferase family 39 protein [Deltaproteobacteria bacterium]|nr:glycosyltransferase family 39 protein [Deltaproteobacteria bacterium]